MRNLLLGTAISLALASGASAADMYVKAPPPPVWTGFYIGLNGGYGWSASQTLTVTDNRVNSPDSFIGPAPKGGFGGGQIGYNWQVGPMVVLGVEADIQASDIEDSLHLLTPKFANPVSESSKLDSFGTVRGRLGFSFGNSLIYATGGLAYGNVNQSYTYDNRLGSIVTLASNGVETGYVVGGGIEYKFSRAWSLKAEYQYLNLGSHGITASWTGPQAIALPGTATLSNVNLQYNTVRLGLNFRL